MYRKTPFRVAPLEDVEMDLKELHDRGEKITRIYLTNGDPFKFSSIIIFFITKNKPDFLYDSFIQKVRLVF